MIIYYESALTHHGIQGQKWGHRNGPPYPLSYTDYSSDEKTKLRFKRSDASLQKKINKAASKANKLEKKNETKYQTKIAKYDLKNAKYEQKAFRWDSDRYRAKAAKMKVKSAKFEKRAAKGQKKIYKNERIISSYTKTLTALEQGDIERGKVFMRYVCS